MRHAGPEAEEKYRSCKYIKSFESFYEYVRQDVVDGHNIVYMSKLTEKLVKTVRTIDNEDASNYKAFRLRNCRKDFHSWSFTSQDEDS